LANVKKPCGNAFQEFEWITLSYIQSILTLKSLSEYNTLHLATLET